MGDPVQSDVDSNAFITRFTTLERISKRNWH
jgi:hypothetical protein